MDKKKILNSVRKHALLTFVIVSAVFNVLNYLKMNELKGIGTPYQWEQSQVSQSEGTVNSEGTVYSDRTVNDDVAAAEIHREEITETVISQDNGKININTASVEELQQLTGIGEAKAEAIAAYRSAYGDFTCIEELMEVKGIGEGIFSKIKDQVTVE